MLTDEQVAEIETDVLAVTKSIASLLADREELRERVTQLESRINTRNEVIDEIVRRAAGKEGGA